MLVRSSTSSAPGYLGGRVSDIVEVTRNYFDMQDWRRARNSENNPAFIGTWLLQDSVANFERVLDLVIDGRVELFTAEEGMRRAAGRALSGDWIKLYKEGECFSAAFLGPFFQKTRALERRAYGMLAKENDSSAVVPLLERRDCAKKLSVAAKEVLEINLYSTLEGHSSELAGLMKVVLKKMADFKKAEIGLNYVSSPEYAFAYVVQGIVRRIVGKSVRKASPASPHSASESVPWPDDSDCSGVMGLSEPGGI